MTGAELMAVIGFAVLLASAGWRVWARVEAKVKIAADKGDKAIGDLAAHRLHIAETYVIRAGMHEQAIEGVGNRIDSLGG
ncbi:hypothetical protein [Neorhizobium sp. DT-125]|uniref:hypothetical protein n=1 Tax=Neorhizobium sp. DT-125 TaxID=3396163 RepID=UPI003F1D8FD1